MKKLKTVKPATKTKTVKTTSNAQAKTKVTSTHTSLLMQIKKGLENISSGKSTFEFQSFFLESYPTPARQLVDVMKRIEELYEYIDNLSKFISDFENNRAYIEAQHEIKILTDWYVNQSNKDEILKRFDKEEPEYWAYVLGREAAMEVLSFGRTTKETMDKMSHLPEKNFEEAVQTCVRFATLITTITENVEQELSGTVSNVSKT